MTTAEKLLRLHTDFDEVYSKGYEKGKAEGGGVDNTFIDSVITRTITHLESDTATSVANNAFSDFTALLTVRLPLVETVGTQSFRRCYALTEVNLPKVKTLSAECFYGDNNLSYIDLPQITQIQKAAFASSGLKTLIIRTNQVCVLQNVTAFQNTPIADGTGFIFVKDELVEIYKSATNWSTYANQIKGISELEVSE